MRQVLIIFLCFLNLFKTVHSELLAECITPNNETAYCIPLSNCEALLPTTVQELTERKEFLQQSHCGFDDNHKPLVCCGYKTNFDKVNFDAIIFDTLPISHKIKELLLPPGECGQQLFADKIFGGSECGLDEFPWMALLGYRDRFGKHKDFNCGGVLISSRYVLTAAHCIRKPWIVYKVRLGEHDTSTDIDCVNIDGEKDCNEPAMDYFIENIIVHPDYSANASYIINDIALIRLAKEVQFTDFIKPICLPLDTEPPEIGEKYFVAGWGKVDSIHYSNIKLKIDLKLVDQQYCKNIFTQFKIQVSDNVQICALGDEGKDSCQGDSGGPLMRNVLNSKSYSWYVDGLVSFGPKYCALRYVPGVYTNVGHYLRWIIENMTI